MELWLNENGKHAKMISVKQGKVKLQVRIGKSDHICLVLLAYLRLLKPNNCACEGRSYKKQF